MSSPSPWNYEEDTRRWYMWDESGQRRYEQELHQGSSYSSTQQGSYQDSTPRTTHVASSSRRPSSKNPHHRRESVSYSSHDSRRESRRDSRPRNTATGSSTSDSQSTSYYDQGDYGAPQASQPSRGSEYGSPAVTDYQTNPVGAHASQGYNVARSNVPLNVAFSPSVTDRMASLSMNESSKAPAYIASPTYSASSSTFATTSRQTFVPQNSYSSTPVFSEERTPRVGSDQYSTAYQGESSAGMNAPPQTDNRTSQSPAHRHVAGTPGDREKLDSRYQIRNHDYKKFFKAGRVFSTLWTVPASGKTNNNETFISYVKFGERVHTKIRRFVVVKQRSKHCTCLPVTSYEGRGYKKPDIDLNEHGPIYSSKRPRNVPEITKKALKVTLSKGAEPLRDPSLINYGCMYTVETNVKVMDVGVLDPESLDLLQDYYLEANYPTPTSARPQRDDMDLAGVGTGLSSGSQALTSDSRGGYATSSGHDRASSFSSGGYNTSEPYRVPVQVSSGHATTPGYSTQPSMASSTTGYSAPVVSSDQYVTPPASPANTRYAAPATGGTASAIAYSSTDTSRFSPRSDVSGNRNYTTQPPYPSATTQPSALYPPDEYGDDRPSITPRGSDPSTTSMASGGSNATYSSASRPIVSQADYSYRSPSYGTSRSTDPNSLSPQDSHREEVFPEDDEDDIDLPTREEVEATRSSRSHRESVSRSSRYSGRDRLRDDTREKTGSSRHHERSDRDRKERRR